MRLRTISLLLVLAAGFFCQLIFGVCANAQSLDTTFSPVVNNYIHCTAVQPDGKIIVGGRFSVIAGGSRSYIARLNQDGSLDTTFASTGANNLVYSVAIQEDGKILVGGNFSFLNGVARNGIGRLNGDGSLDTTFDPNSGGFVYCMALQPDGKIVVGGGFSSMGGVARNRIARINQDGSLDTTFNPGDGANSTVLSLTVQGDGKIVVGGAFTSLAGIARNYIGRLNADGTLDTAFNAGVNNLVRCLTLQPDGMIIVGGDFSAPKSYIARLNADGSTDTTFNPGTGANGPVYSAAILANGKILLGGNFTTLSGQPRSYFGRLNSDGSLDYPFAYTGEGANNMVLSVAIQPDGKMLLAGGFTAMMGVTRWCIARILLTEPAPVQDLQVEARTTLKWMRSGPLPELDHVWFESSPDQTTWSPLGSGTRISGGWQATGLDIACETDIYLRGRGYGRGGNYNGSESLYELAELFNIPSITLTVGVSGTGVGTVSSDPAGIDCGSDCSEEYCEGIVVTLTATPDIGSSFGGWTGDCAACGTNPECAVTVDAAKSCTATFNCDALEAPVILSAHGHDPCILDGIEITWGAVAGASGYDILIDSTTTVSGVSNPYIDNAGNEDTHNYQVRAVNSCTAGPWSEPVAGRDDIAPGPPAIISAVDDDPYALTGVRITFSPGNDATGHDLFVDGALKVIGFVSEQGYLPNDTISHEYSLRAIDGSGCVSEVSPPFAATDADGSPCVPPDEWCWIYLMTASVPDNYPILNFQDPNQENQRTGWNIRRSNDASLLPKSSWPVVCSNCVDMDSGTPNYQWTDSSGESPGEGQVWYYLVTAYNDNCPAEGPFSPE